MEEKIRSILLRQNISTHKNQGILIAPVLDQSIGFRLAKEMLYAIVDPKTALFLSGGRTPKRLYHLLAEEKKLDPGVVGFVDERFGEPMHESSNELMLKESGLLDYLLERKVKFHSILSCHPEPFGMSSRRRMLDSGSTGEERWIPGQARNDRLRELVSEAYDQLLRSLFTVYQRSVATLGIGLDGHTAGIAGNRADFKNPIFDQERKHLLVSEFNDPEGMFKQRITMTFLGLSMMDYLLVLVFGDDKKDALEKLFESSKDLPPARQENDVPARFLKRPEIAKKTIIITDQRI